MTTATTALTCAAMYEYDLTFRSAIAKWVADRRCPLELADYLRENDLHAAADCADWCAAQPDQDVYCVSPGEPYASGIFPFQGINGNYFWSIYQIYESFCHAIPARCYRCAHDGVGVGEGIEKLPRRGFESPEAAILALLDNWKVAQ